MPARKSPKGRTPQTSPGAAGDRGDEDPLELLARQVSSMGIGGPSYVLQAGGFVELSVVTYSEASGQREGWLGLPVQLMGFLSLRLGQLVELRVLWPTDAPGTPSRGANIDQGESTYVLRASCFNGPPHTADVTGLRIHSPKLSPKSPGAVVLLVRPFKTRQEVSLPELRLTCLGPVKGGKSDYIGAPERLGDKGEIYIRKALTGELPLYDGLRLRLLVNGSKRLFVVQSDVLRDGVVGYVGDRTTITLLDDIDASTDEDKTPDGSRDYTLDILKDVRSELTSIVSSRFFSEFREGVTCSAAICGTSGTGKRTLVRSVSDMLGAKLLTVDSEDGFEQVLRVLQRLREKTIVLIPDIETLVAGQGDGLEMIGEGADRALILKDAIDRLRASSAPVFVVATTESADDLGLGAERASCFPFELVIGALTDTDRMALFRHSISRNFGFLPSDVTETMLARISAVSTGFTAGDVASVIRYVRTVLGEESHGDGSAATLDKITHSVALQAARTTPRVTAESVAAIPETKFSDIGGLESLKRQLGDLVDASRARRLRALGVRPYSGCLLYGPPGCAKTLLARALAGETSSSFLVIAGSQLVSPFVGESERRLHRLFSAARHAAPAILFFDELDALAPAAGSGGPGGSGMSRLVSALAAELDDVGVANEAGAPPVVVIGATNSPDGIDRSLLRGGRFDTCVYVGTPDVECREAILGVHTRAMPISGVSLPGVASRTEGYTGAELAAVCQRAGRAAIARGSSVVECEDFELALRGVLPRTTPAMLEAYRRFGGANVV